ncbi:3'-5' exoribonuclease YhaM family protein [Thalassoroseus pseudoceratinae]|uniref:3'-5' exoribonuclease YhaM family protein n=1 Tax=Thalassoroseus pseudoceratinae TaxID=2713176 RepID=UPI00141F607C|nr:HD domain-containing protein [Thalassoroseus pseudoceratinae]
MAAEPRIVRLSELETGQSGDCFVILTEKNRHTTRDGKPFYRIGFRDSARAVTAMVWQDSAWFEECESQWQPDQYYKIRCRYEETSYGPQVDIDRIREVVEADTADGFDIAEFHPHTRFDIDELEQRLRQIAQEEISDPALKRLVLELLIDHAELLRKLPAATRNHHAYTGGYLEHVVAVTETAVYLADKYDTHYPNMQPRLSKSLVVAGAILHDVGKIAELRYRPQGSQYTAEGRLIGHILLGRDMVREKAATIPDFDAEVLLRLEHIIVAHQNLPEWGSPVAPHTPEALLVHIADDADAKFHMLAMALSAPADNSEFTDRQNPLRRTIFRGFVDE